MENNLGNKKTMATNIKRLMEFNGKTRLDICNELGIKYTTFADWINAKTYPRIDAIEKLANYFHVSKAELVEEHYSIVPENYSDEDKAFIEKFNNAPDDVRSVIKTLLEIKNKE